MSKVLKCREVGMDCDFEARGETEQQVMQKAAEHAKSEHQIPEITPELAVKVKSAIRDE
jgi:predicted small metal-binding protein